MVATHSRRDMSTACRCLIRSWEGEAGRPPGLYVIFTAAYPYFMNGACAAWASVLRLAAGSQNGFWSQSFFAGSGWLLTASGTVIAVITLYQVRSKNSAFRRALIMITRRQTNRDLKELLRQLKRISGSPYLTGVPSIRPLLPARPDPAGRPYGALAATRPLATFRDRRRQVRPENRGPAGRCRHSRGRFPHTRPLACPKQVRWF